MRFFSLASLLLAGMAMAVPMNELDVRAVNELSARTLDPPACAAACILFCMFDPPCIAICTGLCSGTVEPGRGVTKVEKINGEWHFDSIPLPPQQPTNP